MGTKLKIKVDFAVLDRFGRSAVRLLDLARLTSFMESQACKCFKHSVIWGEAVARGSANGLKCAFQHRIRKTYLYLVGQLNRSRVMQLL